MQMRGFLYVVMFFGMIALVASPIVYVFIRKAFREQKNFERGLKMVPLLIHLPPPSEDIDAGARDSREVLDETISKAQILFGVIASTLKKGMKSNFYGQRHFALEIVGYNGFVKFYAAVPIALVDVVKQAIVSAYPTAQLEEVAEHNIFSPAGKMSGTVGGELSLKEHFAYPIATYQELKRDAMQALLNALADLGKEDGVGIQMMMRPADPKWRKESHAKASAKRKGEKDKKGGAATLWWFKQVGTALYKPPENQGGDERKDISSTDQAIVDAIEDKTRHPGYETMIRVVASSNVSHRAQSVLNSVMAAFSLYDAQGRNGFKFTQAKDIERFVTSYILRMFPPEQSRNILNSVELATLFHFPDQSNIPTSQLERQGSKQVDGPRNIPEEGLMLGYNFFRGSKKPIRLDPEDRRRHIYAVGQTGTGKSTFLENLAYQDMINGDGFAFVDPHGDTADRLLSMVPKERTEDVIYFNPSEMEYPMGLNLFEFKSPDEQDFLIQECIEMLYKLYDPQRQGIIGPRYEHTFRMLAKTVMANPVGGTFIDLPKLFTDKAYEQQLKKHLSDPTVLDFWNKEMAGMTDYHKSEITGWIVSKFGAFLGNEMMRNIIGQTKSSFDLREIMDNKKIFIVNLSKGKLGDLNSKLLGMVFVMKFNAAAMSRAHLDEDERQDFCLYVDEFQNFATESFATILSEARKYRLNLIVANQFTTQLTDEIRDAVFGNIGTIVSFRVGQQDAEVLGKYFSPQFDPNDLLRVPNWNAVVRTLINGVPTNPFSMAGIPAMGSENKELFKVLKQLSAAKYGRPKDEVEKEIFSRLSVKEQPRSAFSSTLGTAPSTTGTMNTRSNAAQNRPQPAKSSGSSFLDEWLAKRKSAKPSPVEQRAPQNVSQQPSGASPMHFDGKDTREPGVSTKTQQGASRDFSQEPKLSSTHSGLKPQASPPQDQGSKSAQSSKPRADVGTSFTDGSRGGKPSNTEDDGDSLDDLAAEIKKDTRNDQDQPKPALDDRKKTEGEISLRGGEESDSGSDDGVIVIDQDGNLHHGDQ